MHLATIRRVQGFHLDAPAFIGCGVLLGQVAGQDIHHRLRLRNAHTCLQPRLRLQITRSAATGLAPLFLREHQGHKDIPLLVPGEPE